MDWFTINPKLMRYLTNTSAWLGSEQASYLPPASLIFRPVQADDVELILEMHQRLSLKTIYHRYHSPRVPTRQEIAQICRVADGNGRTLVAAIDGKKPAVVGMAYYIVSSRETAEVALLVEDRVQRQGIGKRLLRQLTDLALAQGIGFFDAYVLLSNKPVFHMLYNTGTVVYNRMDYGAREIRIQLTAVSTSNLAYEPEVLEDAVCLAA